MNGVDGFAARLIDWHRRCGRRDLPWQCTRDPYRVWLAEIMLQQTRVATVIPYYRRFLSRFPEVGSLAGASLDQVLELWSGLGYYSRARNLHGAALQVVSRYGGRFPRTREALATLPGVGRSTAAAIAVFCFGEREAILEGNVKRVLSRCFAVEGFSGDAAVRKRLWTLAESLLPREGIERYTQGLMDLGALVCTRTRPRCGECPFSSGCEAKRLGAQSQLPVPRPRKALPKRRTVMLVALREGQVLLQKRPPTGVWAGLWSLPEFPSRVEALREGPARLGITVESQDELQPLRHSFTHYSLTITPVLCRARAQKRRAQQPGIEWFPLARALECSIPAPVRTLLKRAGKGDMV